MSDPIDALTQIIQSYTGCGSDDRPRERCVVHDSDWPCIWLDAFVAEVQSWAETYLPKDVLDCEACRNGEHGRIDEETDACLCCGTRYITARRASDDSIVARWPVRVDGAPRRQS